MLRQIHNSHLGIVKRRQRAREVLFWPGMSVEIEQMVNNCSVCADYTKNQPSEPLKPSVPPSLPWKKIGTDLFESRGEHYLSLSATAANSLKSQSWSPYEVEL